MKTQYYKLNKAIMGKYGFEYKTKGVGKGAYMRTVSIRNFFVSNIKGYISITQVTNDSHRRERLILFKINNDAELEFILNRCLYDISGIPINETVKIIY